MRGLRHILVLLVTLLMVAQPVDVCAQKKTTTTKTTTTKKSTSKKTTTKKAAPARKKSMSRAEYEKQQKDLQKQIATTEKMISDNNQSVKAQSRDIKLREQEIGKRRDLLTAMQKEIEAINEEEDSLKKVITDLQASFNAKKVKYGMAMRHMYKNRSGLEELTFVLASNSLSESVRRLRYLQQYSEWRKGEAEALEEQRVATEAAKDYLVKTREERQEVLTNIDNERAALTQKQHQQEVALANLKQKGKELQAELERDQKQQAEIQRKIQQMIEEERRKAEEARRKAEEAERKKAEAAAKKAGQQKPSSTSTTSGKTTSSSSTNSASTKTSSSSSSSTNRSSSNTSSANLTGSFRQNKGRLPYPVDSNFAFLRHYKEKNDGNVSISLSTSVGANACAVFEGTVLRCSRSSDDYTVIISHGDYMSVYSNLSSVSVSQGQKVKARQAIGKIKSDVDGRRGELMFWIYGKSDAENPEAWLRR